MCFAPYISLSTFVIEFMLALFFLFKNPKDKLNRIIALISFTLGFYQLNEFLICTIGVKVFTVLAWQTTALLPAFGITYALIMWRTKMSWYWNLLIYSPVLLFLIYFPFAFDVGGQCMTVFIQYTKSGLIFNFYELYYMLYIVAGFLLFYIGTGRTKSIYEKRLFLLGAIGMLIFTVPTYVFLIFLPQFNIQFASVFCEFGLLLAIEMIVILWYKEKHKIKY